MARKKGQDNFDLILVLINETTHQSTRKKFESQKDVIRFLKQKNTKSATRKEIQKVLGLQFEKYPKNSPQRRKLESKFYNIVSQLLQWVIESDGQTYRLSYDLFQRKLSSIRRAGENYFK